MIVTKLLARLKIAEFIQSAEGQKAFENMQRDIVYLSDIPANLPVFADQAAALAGGLAVGTLFRTSAGVVMVKT